MIHLIPEGPLIDYRRLLKLRTLFSKNIFPISHISTPIVEGYTSDRAWIDFSILVLLGHSITNDTMSHIDLEIVGIMPITKV